MLESVYEIITVIKMTRFMGPGK